MTFQLWDTESANLVGSYASEDAALAVVQKAVEVHGPAAVASLLLLQESARGRLKRIAEGSALVDLAIKRATSAA
jgi:hypothetical protein